jgi:glycosyltransferase involved in cell wall biosynthesis
LATGLAAGGHEVTVLTGRRAYDRPWVRFSRRETLDGVDIVRIASTGFGKAARWRRALDFGSFLVSCFFRLLMLPRYDVTVCMSSPPMISSVAALMVAIRGGNLACWVLDLNPDEALAAGWLREDSSICRMLKKLATFGFAMARKIVVMDRFMARRVAAYGIPEEKITVVPPWSHNESVHYDAAGRDAFRHENGLEGRFVVMYSGNHSPCHPLDTLLEAARRMKNDQRVVFCFVGGGSEFGRVKAYASGHRLRNILCLPYVPMNRLSSSLSAADMHAVVMGEQYVGIVHTCKVYNVLALGIPFLYIGPEPSHISDLAVGMGAPGWMARAGHGDVDSVVRIIRSAAAAALPAPNAAEQAVSRKYSQDELMPVMFEVLREATGQPSPAVAANKPISK